MRVATITLMLILVGCNATVPTKNTNVIVADGTEVQQFEALFFCSDKDGFMKTVGDVGSKLSRSWDEVLGKENDQDCTIRISTDEGGNIVGYAIVSCENESAVKKVIEKASPIPVPGDSCLRSKIDGIKYTLNSRSKNS